VSPFPCVTLQGVTAASSGTHTHAGAESRRLAWRCLARPSAGHRSYRRGAAEIPAGVSVMCKALEDQTTISLKTRPPPMDARVDGGHPCLEVAKLLAHPVAGPLVAVWP